ncbi:hypothetical protein A7U43_13830 [Mycobacterium adipatum]|jgi:hypothetical protein|uniref:Transmembrane protein n=1 Tax=Mycobacterium adipatum TaxID=1682113 RepID=A0A172UMP0_9MYCO|nr:hypothetical protein [Mycobacterium adipatum]ANE80246.1 hypothetical protein A7U43_13830 [Mycobacterium adipatum]MBI5737958.1 hypothetical protein [Mycolicibacterium neoaurum]
MLIIALVLAVIGLAALVAAVVTSNELIAWVCIGASVIGVLLLIADALRSRREGNPDADAADADEDEQGVQDYPEEPVMAESESAESEPTVSESAGAEPAEPEPAVAGVTDTDDAEGESGGSVEISPDPEETPKS